MAGRARRVAEVKLTDADYARAAQLLGCDQAAIRAVAAVESGGDGFLPDGRPKILFEAHIFSRLTAHKFDGHPQISTRTWNRDLYKGGAAEYDRLEAAKALDYPAALQSASWGKFQTMGFNYKRCGFITIHQFVEAMYKNEGAHLTAFCNLVKSFGLDDELRNHDWLPFAEGWNGPGFARIQYDRLLANAYDNFHSFEILGAKA